MFTLRRLRAFILLIGLPHAASAAYLSFSIDRTDNLEQAKVTVHLTEARSAGPDDRLTMNLHDWIPTVPSSAIHATDGEIDVQELPSVETKTLYIQGAPDLLKMFDIVKTTHHTVALGSPLVLTLSEYGVVTGDTNSFDYKTPFPIFYLPDHSAITLCRDIRDDGSGPTLKRVFWCRDNAQGQMPFYRDTPVIGSLDDGLVTPYVYAAPIFSQGPMLYTANPIFYIGFPDDE